MTLVTVLAVLGLAAGAWSDCLSEPSSGLCDAYFPRYFYNVSSARCDHFVYGGCGGNNNNYHSLTECENACAQLTEEDCTAKPEVGDCRAAFPKFYFDQETGSCKEFIYGGCDGNKNKFANEVECRDKCGKYSKKVLTVEECHARPDPGMCRAYIPSFYFNPKTSRCESFVYGGCGGNTNNFGSVEECQGQCGKFAALAGPEVLCTAEPVVGLCKAAFPRYFYNHHLGRCQKFTYGGCGGNSNNFESLETCENSCAGTKQEAVDCQVEPETGFCKAYMPSFFYNVTSGQCEKFIYGGCGGNTNRFLTHTSCHATCVQGQSKPVQRRSVEVCSQPKVEGPCLAYIPSYYFDVQSQSCQRFVYGGCGGNKNNFRTLQECHDTCTA